MFSKKSLGLSIFVIASIFVISSLSFAVDKNHPYKDHMKNHPRQDQVNKRLDNQTNRANNQAASGQITQQQANKMDRQDKQISNQEQRDIKKNEAEGKGDMITKGQQAQLNREENRVNREDKRDVRKDAANGGAAGAPPAQAPASAPGN